MDESLTHGADAVVTVVIPTCNRREFLPEVVAALRAQTFPSFRAVRSHVALWLVLPIATWAELVGVGVEAVGFMVESVRHRCLLL